MGVSLIVAVYLSKQRAPAILMVEACPSWRKQSPFVSFCFGVHDNTGHTMSILLVLSDLGGFAILAFAIDSFNLDIPLILGVFEGDVLLGTISFSSSSYPLI